MGYRTSLFFSFQLCANYGQLQETKANSRYFGFDNTSSGLGPNLVIPSRMFGIFPDLLACVLSSCCIIPNSRCMKSIHIFSAWGDFFFFVACSCVFGLVIPISNGTWEEWAFVACSHVIAIWLWVIRLWDKTINQKQSQTGLDTCLRVFWRMWLLHFSSVLIATSWKGSLQHYQFCLPSLVFNLIWKRGSFFFCNARSCFDDWFQWSQSNSLLQFGIVFCLCFHMRSRTWWGVTAVLLAMPTLTFLIFRKITISLFSTRLKVVFFSFWYFHAI